MLIMVMGLPGSGKSYFARHLSDRLKARYIGSDQIRKEMDAMGKYRLVDKKKVYEQMNGLAAAFLKTGETVILDATFYKEELRSGFIILAKDQGLPYGIIWIHAKEEIIKERLSRKRADSEADYGIYVQLLKEFEGPESPFLKLTSTQDNIHQMLESAEGYIQQLP